MKKTKEVSKLSQEQLDILNQSYPVSTDDSNSLILPRFGLLSKDLTEITGTGKNKKIKIIQASGTFFTDSDEGEVDKDNKNIWTRKFLDGDKQDVIILYHRRQLRMYDSSLEKFYSTPVFDGPDQVLNLYLDKQVVQKGTQKQLQVLFPSTTLKGKLSSKLKEDCILFVLVGGVLHQCNLSQSSKWEFKSYKKNLNPSTVITTLGSIEETFGDNTYRKMTFSKKRLINNDDEFNLVVDNQKIIQEKVESDKRFFLPDQADKDFDALPADGGKTND